MDKDDYVRLGWFDCPEHPQGWHVYEYKQGKYECVNCPKVRTFNDMNKEWE